MARIAKDSKGFVIIVEVAKGKDSDYNPSNVTEAALLSGYKGIAEATPLLGIKYSQYTRRILLEGKLDGIKVVTRGSAKWFIDNDSISSYRNVHDRSKAVRNYVLKIRKEDETKVRNALKKAGVKYSLALAYSS